MVGSTPHAPPPDAGLVHRAGQTVVLGEPHLLQHDLALGPAPGIEQALAEALPQLKNPLVPRNVPFTRAFSR